MTPQLVFLLLQDEGRAVGLGRGNLLLQVLHRPGGGVCLQLWQLSMLAQWLQFRTGWGRASELLPPSGLGRFATALGPTLGSTPPLPLPDIPLQLA